ncbi:MAG: glycosyltransferase family 4 protein [Candidatus Dormibacteria bacterium]
MTSTGPLRVALLSYRGNPYSGGQGVFVRHLSTALRDLGHAVTFFSGQPYPVVEEGVELVEVPSLDLYQPANPFRRPRLNEFHSAIDLLEYAVMCAAGVPEPLTFSLRVWKLLRGRRNDFDIVHDNQCLGWGVAALQRAGVPVIATIHHAVVIDRDLAMAAERTWHRRLMTRRWYHFHRMQARVARGLPRVLTVSEQSRRDIAQRMGVHPERIGVVPIAVDGSVFTPLPELARVRGRIFAVASSDAPLKGVLPLLRALATLRGTRPADLVILGEARPGGAVAEAVRSLGLTGAVRFVRGIDDGEVARCYAEAEVAVVPSLYEGFSIPALQALACGVPLVATTAGALPEVTGTDGDTVLLVPPGDSAALAGALGRILDDPGLRRRLSAAGRRRATELFSWRRTAEAMVAEYRALLGDRPAC